jgi:hypothetical protein
VTDQGRNSPTADDEDRWAEALSILEQAPTGSAARRQRRIRRRRLLLTAAFSLVLLLVAALVGLLFLDVGTAEGDDARATWVTVLGLCVSTLGLLVIVIGGVLLVRDLRRSRSWRSPLDVLTFRQRRELVHQLRGRAALVPSASHSSVIWPRHCSPTGLLC